jgi:hypothetical protein
MVRRHGPDFDCRHAPLDPSVVHASDGGKVHGWLALTYRITQLLLTCSCTKHTFQNICRYTFFYIVIDSAKVRSKRTGSSSRSSISCSPTEQDLKLARVPEEMRQQREYFLACMQQQQTMFQVSINNVNSKFIY